MIGITMFQSAYTAEAVRGGLAAIPGGRPKPRWRLDWDTGGGQFLSLCRKR